MITQELIAVGDKKVEVRAAGDGPPILYLHSAMGDFWLPEFLEPLTNSYRVVCPALPGFGESTGIEEIADVEDVAFHYDEFLKAAGLSRPHVVGLSLGGWLAAEFAVRWPEKLRSLVLIDAVGLSLDHAPTGQLWGIEPSELGPLLFEDQDFPLAQLLASFSLDEPPPEEIFLQFLNSQATTARLGWDPYLHDPKLRERLGRINFPTLVIWAENDRLVPLAHGEEYASLIPKAKLMTVAGGHLAALENPRPVSDLIRSFLDEIPTQ